MPRQQRAGDDQALDLARALVDLGDLGVAVVALGRELLRVAVAAEDLDRLAGPAPRDARRRTAWPARPRPCAGGRPPSAARRARSAPAPPRSRSACRRASAGSPGSAPIGLPNVRRSLRVGRCARSSAACAMPVAWAAMPMRPPSSVESAMRMPRAGLAEPLGRRVLEGRSAVDEEFRPSLSSSRVAREARRAAAHDEGAECRLRPSRAKTMNVWACEPLVIHCFVPVMRPSRGARAQRAGVGARARTRSARRRRARGPGPAAAPAARPARRCRGRGSAASRARVHGDGHADAGVARARAPRARARRLRKSAPAPPCSCGHADAHQPELAERRRRPRAGSGARGPTPRACGATSSSAKRARERADVALLVGQRVPGSSEARPRAAAARWAELAAARSAARAPRASASAATRRRRTIRRRPRRLEAHDLPALLARDARELGVGVDRDRVADGAQHRQVGLASPSRRRRRPGRCPRARRARASPPPCPRGR